MKTLKIFEGNNKVGYSSDHIFVDNILLENALEAKVDKVEGKGLSTNDFTDDYVTKVDELLLAALELGSVTSVFAKVDDVTDEFLEPTTLGTIYIGRDGLDVEVTKTSDNDAENCATKDFISVSLYRGGKFIITGFTRGPSSVFVIIYNASGTVISRSSMGNDDELTVLLSIPVTASKLRVCYDAAKGVSSAKFIVSNSMSSATDKLRNTGITNLVGLYLPNKKVLLSGASIANSYNGFFEYSMNLLGLTGTNISVAGANIAHLAHKLYSQGDTLVNNDLLLISHTHNFDVYSLPEIFESYSSDDYEQDDCPLSTYIKTSSDTLLFGTLPDLGDYSSSYVYAGLFDYCLKKWADLCYLEDKPFLVGVFTHWHDARVSYNLSIRKLASKWGLFLVKDDENIGFSKEMIHPSTKKLWSLLYAETSRTGYTPKETIDSIEYGWHPLTIASSNDTAINNGTFDYTLDKLPYILIKRASILISMLKNAIIS